MDGWLEETDLLENYDQWYREGEEDCASYMVPYRQSRWAVYYNKALFDERGVPYPEDDWTWEDYARTAEKFTFEKDGQMVYGSHSFEPTSIWWRVPARTLGADDPFVAEDLERFKESAEWNYNLTYERGAQMPYTEQDNNSAYEYDATFLQGKVAMYFCGDWSLAVLNNAIEEGGLDFDYDIAPLPHWEGEEGWQISDAAVLSVFDRTEYPEEAFSFLEFVCGAEGAAVLAANNMIPAWNSEKVKEIYRNAYELPEHREAFFQDGPISMTPASARYTEGMEIVKGEVASYLLQEQSLTQAFDNIEKALEELWQ